MKKVKGSMVITFGLVLLILFSCSKDEKAPSVEKEQLTVEQDQRESVKEQTKEESLSTTEIIEEQEENVPVGTVEDKNQQDESKINTPKQEENQKSVPVKTEKAQKIIEPSANEEKQPEATETVPVYKPVGIPTIQSYLPENNSETRTKPITHVVIHFSSNAANNLQDPYNVQAVKGVFANYGVSAHYLIGRNGDIYELVSENRVAYHAGKGHLPKFPQYKDILNQYSIGIELLAIGTREEMSSMVPGSVYDSINPELIGYTNEQYQALHTLLGDILVRIPSIKKDRDHVIGHDEYAPGRKTDPGSLFDWTRIGF